VTAADALTRILTAAHEARVSAMCKWVSYQPERPREPQVGLLIDGTQWTLFFDRGARGWRLKTAATSLLELRTLRDVLALIADEGDRLDSAEQTAIDALKTGEPA